MPLLKDTRYHSFCKKTTMAEIYCTAPYKKQKLTHAPVEQPRAAMPPLVPIPIPIMNSEDVNDRIEMLTRIMQMLSVQIDDLKMRCTAHQ